MRSKVMRNAESVPSQLWFWGLKIGAHRFTLCCSWCPSWFWRSLWPRRLWSLGGFAFVASRDVWEQWLMLRSGVSCIWPRPLAWNMVFGFQLLWLLWRSKRKRWTCVLFNLAFPYTLSLQSWRQLLWKGSQGCQVFGRTAVTSFDRRICLCFSAMFQMLQVNLGKSTGLKQLKLGDKGLWRVHHHWE